MYIFGQIALLVILTAFAGPAVDHAAQGMAFGITYFLLVSQLAYQWWHLRRIDAPEFGGRWRST